MSSGRLSISSRWISTSLSSPALRPSPALTPAWAALTSDDLPIPRAPQSSALLAGRPRVKRSVFSTRMSRIRSIPLSSDMWTRLTCGTGSSPRSGCQMKASAVPSSDAPRAGGEFLGFRPQIAPTGEGRSSMWITPAYAQGAGAGGSEMLVQLLPFVAIFVIMYFLILRPQQKRVKQHQEMVKNLRRGDNVVTSGGTLGKVTKVVDDDQIEIEIADGVRVRQMKSMVSEVRTKGEPVKDEA